MAGTLSVESTQLIDKQAMTTVKPFDGPKIAKAFEIILARSLLSERCDAFHKQFNPHFQTGMKCRRRHEAYFRSCQSIQPADHMLLNTPYQAQYQ
jgi:hypothetical protein